jgi:hypothetical protein
VFGRYVSKSAENGAYVTVGGLHSALSARAHAARRKRAGTVVVSYTHAGSGRASAGVSRNVGRSPPHAGGKQRGHGQNYQKPRGSAHFACRESLDSHYIRFARDHCGSLCAEGTLECPSVDGLDAALELREYASYVRAGLGVPGLALGSTRACIVTRRRQAAALQGTSGRCRFLPHQNSSVGSPGMTSSM